MEGKEIKCITPETFCKYGVILAAPYSDEKSGNRFDVLVSSRSDGWRLGILRLFRNEFDHMERHIKSKESHEPLSGTTLLLCSTEENPEDIDVFLLDKPVCLNVGVWHQDISLSETSLVKIAENREVPPEESEVFFLKDGFRIKAFAEMRVGSIMVPTE